MIFSFVLFTDDSLYFYFSLFFIFISSGVMYNHYILIKYLIDHSATTFTTKANAPATLINVETNMQWTTLSLAVRAATNTKPTMEVHDNVYVLELIRKYSPDVEVMTKSGLTALIIACGDGLLNIVIYLIEVYGAEPNAQNETGFSPLHAAARSGHDSVVMALLGRGGDLSIEDENGWTCLHFAAQQGHVSTCSLLAQQGGKDFFEIKNVMGESAARIAFKWGKADVLDALSYYE